MCNLEQSEVNSPPVAKRKRSRKNLAVMQPELLLVEPLDTFCQRCNLYFLFAIIYR